MAKPTQAATLATLQSMITGLQKEFPNGTFKLGNVTFTTAAIVQALQSRHDALAAAITARNDAKSANQAWNAANAQTSSLVVELTSFLQTTFGKADNELAVFGLVPRKKPAPLTVEQKAARNAKAAATREARGTTSKKQKLAVTGNVTGVTITPITTPTAPTPTVSPSPAPATPAPTVGK